MGYILLFCIEVVFVVINMRLLKRDIMSPATVTSLGILVATFFSYVESDLWNTDINIYTLVVVFFGLLSATASEGIIKRKIKLNKIGAFDPHKKSDDFSFNKNTYLVLAVITFILFGLYVMDAYRVGISNGGIGLNAFAYMKNAYMYSSGNLMNPIIRQGFKLVMAMAYISSFYLVYNVVINGAKIKNNLSFLFVIVIGLLIVIASGSRTEILRIIFSILLDFSILWREKRNWIRNVNRKSNRQIMKKAMPLVVCIILVAFLSKTIVKTTDVELSSTTSILYYVAYYVGSSISVLNTKLSMGFAGSSLLLPANNEVNSFVYLGDLNYGGNVSTIFGTIVLEYGLLGMMVYIMFIYAIWGYIYNHYLINSYNSYKRNLIMIVYSMFYYVVAMSYYSNCFIEMTNGVTELLTLIIFLFMYRIIIKKHRGGRVGVRSISNYSSL